MKILLVSSRRPWPPFPGSQLRAHLQLAALTACGDVSVAFLLPADEPAPELPPGLEDLRSTWLPVDRRGGAAAIGRWALGARGRGAPWPSTKLAFDRAAGAVRDLVRHDRPDVVWAIDSHLWPALAAIDLDVPLVVDLDDLQDRKIEHRQANRLPLRASSARDLFFRAIDADDRRRWVRTQRDVAARAAASLLCSELDRDRAGLPRVRIVPNGYRLDHALAPDARRPGDGPPRLLYAGNLDYLPNVEALAWFADAVLPEVRRLVPGVEVRVIGRAGHAVAHLRRDPRLTFLGAVPSMDDELARAGACIVPLRSGGGTRIKILEAFAHRVPVVTTTVGAEGLPVTDGEELLVRDDPVAFAAACASVLGDTALAAALTGRAAARYEATATPAVVRAAVRAVIDELASTAATRATTAPGAPGAPR